MIPLLIAAAAAAAQRPPLELPSDLAPEVTSEPPLILLAPPAPVVIPPMLVLAPPRPGVSPEVRAMIDAAYKSGDDKTIQTVLGIAKSNFPDQIPAIDTLASTNNDALDQVRREEHEREQARIAAARFFQIWKGQVEAGGSWSTGTTRVFGFYAATALTRDGIRWNQRFNGRIDIQRTNGETTTERWLAAWQPSYKLSSDYYAFSLIQYEHDRFLGYASRGTLGIGAGYNAVALPNLKVQVEAGPAFRRTDYYAIPTRQRIAGRASTNINWTITPTLTFSQTASIFFESDDTTITTASALDTKLIGDLKGRISYNIQYEQQNPLTSRQLDTITRATLVYSF